MRLMPVNRIDNRTRRRAFTLMEVLVVVAILVVLASVASIYVFRYLEDSKVSAARTSCTTLSNACKAYYLKTNEAPADLSQLVTPPDGGSPYLEDPSALVDPWGRNFQLQVADSGYGTPVFEVFTVGPDGKKISSVKANNQ